MTNRRGPFTTNLAKKDSREVGALLPVLPGSPVSPAGALEASLAEVHSREDLSPSPHPAPEVALVEAVSTHRTPTKSLSRDFGDLCLLTK